MFIKFTGKKVSIVCTIVTIIGASCGAPEYNYEDAKNETYIIGHGGMGFNSFFNPFNPLPENSMRSIKKALELGADGIEVDVQMSKDSVLILYHDNYLDSKTEIDGCVGQRSSKEVIGLEYKSPFPFNLMHSETIISLDSLFDYFFSLDTFPLLYLDLHSYNYCIEKKLGYRDIKILARALVNIFQEKEAPLNKIFPTSSHIPLLQELRNLNPQLQLFYEEDENYEHGLKFAINNKYRGLVLKEALIPSMEKREEARKNNLEIIYFGGKATYTIKEMLQTYPNAIQVNNVKNMREVIDDAKN